MAPYTIAWDTTSALTGPHTLTAVARDATGNAATSSAVAVIVSNDLTPPVQSSIAVSSISASAATITWQTNEPGDSQTEYGLTVAYGNLGSLNSTFVVSHADPLSGLAANSLYHFRVRSRDAAGNLAMSSDFTFGTRDGVPPSVSIVSPVNGATLAGLVSIEAAASDNVGVAGVTFNVDGAQLGAELTSAPYTIALDTTSLSDGAHVLSAVARDAGGDVTTSTAVSVTVANGSLWFAPEDTYLNGNTTNYSSAQTLTTYTWPDYQVANAIVLNFNLSTLPAGALITDATLGLALVGSDAAPATYMVSAHKILGRHPVLTTATGYTSDGVTGWTPNACCYNGVPLAQADISPAYDTRAIDRTSGYKTWNVTQILQDWLVAPATNAGMLLNSDSSVVSDRYRTFASMESADPNLRPFLHVTFSRPPAADTVPPSVSFTAPAPGATVGSLVTVSATASDNVGVVGVQFQLDGVPLGAERTAAPFTLPWDTSSAANGAHTLVAVARDAAGLTASAVVLVTVQNDIVLLAPQDTSLNVNAINYSADPQLFIYTWPDHQAANAILMKFDLGGLPAGAVVQEATLYLALVARDASAATYMVSAHKVVGRNPIIAQATGYMADGVTAWTPNTCCYNSVPVAQADISTAYDTRAIDRTLGYKTWTITQMVQEWVDQPGTNAGLLLNSDLSALQDRYRTFASVENSNVSLRPYLRIRYTR